MRTILTIALLAFTSFVANAQQPKAKPAPMPPAKKAEPVPAPTPAPSVTVNVVSACGSNRGMGLFGNMHQRRADRHQRIADRHQNAADRIAARRGACQ